MALTRPEPKQRNPPEGGLSKTSGITALIDGDIPAYSIGYACQTTIREVWVGGRMEASFESMKELKEWKEKFGYTKEDTGLVVKERIEADSIANCLHSVKVFLNNILEATDAQYYKIYLTGKGNFRDDVATIKPYKGNRHQAPPIHKDAIRQYLIDYWDAELIEGTEADDALAINQTDKTVICTTDKDLSMVEGWAYNWGKDEKPRWISKEEGIYWFYKQLLMGDSTDNIQGIPGIGPKKAEKILAECGSELSMYLAVFEAYASSLYPDGVGTDDEDADVYETLLENAYLLWMVRELDEDDKPVMWEPPE